jgi:hypothetical protein
MAVGRISGPLLKANLIRNGVDLAFETDLLYLDVNNGRVGIKTTSPTHDFQVAGKIYTDNLQVGPANQNPTQGLLQIGNLEMQGNEIRSSLSTISLIPAGNDPVIYHSKIHVDSLELNDNYITTLDSNAPIELRPNGTGTIELVGNTNVTGNLYATGNITAGGNINLGDTNTDTVKFNADIISDILPDVSDTYRLGSPSKRWKALDSNYANIGTIQLGDNVIQTINSNEDLVIRANGTGKVRINNLLLNEEGNTWHVTTNGDDTEEGTSVDSAFATIKHALSVATNGDIIKISAGEFTEIFPLTVPAGVTIVGAGIRATSIKPTVGTNDLDGFYLAEGVVIQDLTVKDMFYNSGNDTGYAFAFNPAGTTVALRSPYLYNITVLNKGSTTSSSDPYGYVAGDAGRGIKADGQYISRSSIEAALLCNEITIFSPNQIGLLMTNGIRVEWLNCFTYFCADGILAQTGTVGRGGDGKTWITFSGVSGSGWQVGETITVTSSDGSSTFNFTVDSVSGDGNTVYIDGKYDDLNEQDLTPGSGGSIIGGNSGTTATGIIRYSRQEFAAEMRSNGSACVYGIRGVTADGPDVSLRLMSQNFGYIGVGYDLTNNLSNVIQTNEVNESNGGRVFFTSVDSRGDFRVGNSFKVDQDTGNVVFAAPATEILSSLGIQFTDGANTTTINPVKVETGNLRLSGNTFSSTAGDIIIDPIGDNKTTITGDAEITGGIAQITDKDKDTKIVLESFLGADEDEIKFYAQGNLVATIDKDKFSTTQFEVDLVRLVNNSLQTYQNDNTLELFAHGTGYVDFPDTNAIRIARGTTGQRPGTPQEGMVRFNTNSLNFEGYDGAFWNVLGGSKGIIIDQDQNTYMTAELTQGANDDTIRSYIAGTVRADLNGTRFNTPRVHTDVISTEGTDANLTITPNGTGKVIIGDLEIDQTTNTITNVETNGRTTFDVPNGEGWVSFAGSYGIKVPTGDINNRPIGTPDTGLLRYNTGLGRLEIWTGTTWGSVVGAGGGATLQEAEDLSIINALIFG